MVLIYLDKDEVLEGGETRYMQLQCMATLLYTFRGNYRWLLTDFVLLFPRRGVGR